MKESKFKTGDVVWTCYDPNWYDQDMNPADNIMKGIIKGGYRVRDDAADDCDYHYEIQTEDGTYERHEDDCFATLQELQEAYTGVFLDDLEYWDRQIEGFKKDIRHCKEEMQWQKKRLKLWKLACEQRIKGESNEQQSQ